MKTPHSKALDKVKKVEGYHRELKKVMKKHSFGKTFVNKPVEADYSKGRMGAKNNQGRQFAK